VVFEKLYKFIGKNIQVPPVAREGAWGVPHRAPSGSPARPRPLPLPP